MGYLEREFLSFFGVLPTARPAIRSQDHVSKLRIELIAPFIDGARETFQTMAGISIRRKDVYLKEGFEMFGDISGVIGLSGVTTGTCAVSLPEALAVRFVGRMLELRDDMKPEETDVRDAVGELVNMIAGRAKTILSETVHTFEITLPTIISGGKHEIFIRTKNDCVVILFETDNGEDFALDVCVASGKIGQ